MHDVQPTVLMIGGPTASGKSAVAMQLAQALNGEIIGADSMQIYQGLDIGTAKPTAADRAAVPHHLVDILPVTAAFSVAAYLDAARAAIAEVARRGKLPIVCGGTGLYLSGLLNNADYSDLPHDPERRAAYEQQASTESGRQALWALLNARDPDRAAALHPNNVKRVIRALEVGETTGRPVAPMPRQHQAAFDARLYLINHDRPILYDRINRRVALMMADGLLSEVQWLLDQPVDRNATCWQAIGYKEFLPYLEGQSDLDTCVAALAQASRRYAKRQITWFRHQTDGIWINNQDTDGAAASIRQDFEAWQAEHTAYHL